MVTLDFCLDKKVFTKPTLTCSWDPQKTGNDVT